ncbi:MAG: Thioredoxin reductase [Candidatus Uhrbacteria bacterium GW2011_GWF2_41_16]|uniref:Thioredoxin reductase n=2 Tax=Candidatus Uhriibacteriota TaxID=1752732 RepID=A0A0G0VCU6_9BACT|nr:MAG: Thioredoxin reductase [Candidatus Uhrbacteria bacterium GW2011_GWA2_41_10]KKR87754.1 MAG: Thioredoxin reductase [Candidatus Uhrbacteria bacterium GW2011_GWC2_41_11]KKR98693.1 MAG: Thioredoxin reductase [Candidatus Uhrbacteria bacterium GW2011_GWF2_41_16]
MAKEKLIIIGSGPAGLTAALYAARAELQPILFEGQQAGGQLTMTTEVENFPGFPSGILGTDLMSLFKKQAERFGTRVMSETVVDVDFSVPIFSVKTDKETYQAETVLIATGASAMWLGIPGEQEYQGRGVSACATCDGFFFRGKEIVVSGGGDAAMEEALFLSRFVDKITVVVRRDELRASKIMQERVKKNSKVSFLWNTEIREVLGDGQKLTSLRLWNNKTEEESIFLTNGLFVAIGHKPNTSLFEKWIALDEKGYIRCEEGSTRTNIEGIFAAGDVADHVYRQAITAAGTGCMAAIDIERWLGSR